jgi:hypothetical protein
VLTTYTLTRTFDGDEAEYTSVTVTDRDAINCAYLLAGAFNRISRNFTLGYVMAVVDTQNGIVHFDGKTEELKKPEPWSTERTFTFNATGVDTDTILSILDADGVPKFTTRGKFSTLADVATDDEVLSKASEALAKAGAGALSRSVLEEAYVELQAVKAALENAGVETIPADAGVYELANLLQMRDGQIEDLTAENEELHKRDEFEHRARTNMERKQFEQSKIIEQRDVEIAELKQREVNRTSAARDELIEFTRGAYEKLCKVDPEGNREDLQNRYWGMLDVLANLLVAIGEADRDERHAVARRLVQKPEG